MAANTPVTYYIDTPSVRAACREDFARIDKACKPEQDTSEKNKHPMLKKMLGAERVAALESLTNKVKKDRKYQEGDDNAWMSHCDGLWVKPDAQHYADQIKEFNEQIQAMAGDMDGYIRKDFVPMLDKLNSAVEEAVKNKTEQLALRTAARYVAGLVGLAADGVGVVVTEGAAFVWNVGDNVNTMLELYSLRNDPRFREISSMLEIAQKAQGELDELARSVANKSPTDLMAEGMGILSRLNPCTRARRCLLVQFGTTGTAESMGGKGCCSGQTGHHVIPDEAAKSGCSGYSKDGSPTVCVEGTNNSNSTHGKIHADLDDRVEKYRKGWFGGETATYAKMRDMGIDSLQSTFPESKCSTSCIRAQLDAYYKDKCKQPMSATAGMPSGQGSSNKRK